MNNLVSIVVPVYNVEKFLDRCVRSIVEQTYGNIEVILVNDGSKDTSPEICDKWAQCDSRVKVIHKENAGAGFARNTGIDAAKGKYILFVDSDDYIAPTAVEKCVAELEKSGSDLVMFGRFNVTPDGKETEKPMVDDKLYFEGDEVVNDILPGLFTYERGSGISTCCKMYNLELINRLGIRYKSEREILSEDAFLNLELFAHVRSVSIIPESFYYYYKNDNSLSRSYRKNLHTLNDAFLKNSLELCRRVGYPERVVNYIKARYHIYALGGIKQIAYGSFTKAEKDRLLKEVFENETLHSTLDQEALKLETVPMRLFYTALKFRQYRLCKLLLKLKK